MAMVHAIVGALEVHFASPPVDAADDDVSVRVIRIVVIHRSPFEHGPLRFSELSERVPPIGDRMLTARFKELETRGLVARTVERGPPVPRTLCAHRSRARLPARRRGDRAVGPDDRAGRGSRAIAGEEAYVGVRAQVRSR
jgi:hypothetical protein